MENILLITQNGKPKLGLCLDAVTYYSLKNEQYENHLAQLEAERKAKIHNEMRARLLARLPGLQGLGD